MRKIVRVIDSINKWSGEISHWLLIVLMLVMCYQSLMRYGFNDTPFWAFDSTIMIGAALFAMSYAYSHLFKAHIRIDVFYQHLSPRKKASIDVLCSLFFFFPLVIVLIQAAFTNALEAWAINEVMQPSSWYPPLAPLRTVVLIGLVLFALQNVANTIRDSYLLIWGKDL